ncbi:gas vesicle protein GvpG [Streptomyces meridianus]|uniref:Gas vesicle protein GvpG n=1 Tax=Streptomyces meridianus TaxID=2938945 RepID=A0ABT0XBU1_9ACTN|nr:gas vesicle protein GvpG [Streptomyces meridianus]MCM2579966.1 gas vesicle protein GvpG [Streptomyces meridianus]
MGLFTEVLLLPLAPVRSVIWVTDRLQEAAENELRDPAVLRARLALLNEAYEQGQIGEAEFEREEERVLDLLESRPAPARTDVRQPPGMR